jgi:hypothetical protein
MATRSQKRLPGVLARHTGGGELKRAFERVNEAGEVRKYERTALTRWLSGESTPSNEPFMKRLAEELRDPEIMVALAEDSSATDRDIRDLMTRFHALNAEQKRALVATLAGELSRDHSATRTSFKMRIELHAGLTADCHRLDVSLAWVGRLPAGATVEVAPDEEDLGLAYSREQCIFRELVPLEAKPFTDAMTVLHDRQPVLRFKPAGASSVIQARIQNGAEPVGVTYQFDNEEIRSAEIRLTASLPYPADLSMYPVVLGAYPVAGRAEITMVTDPGCSGRPHALRFLGNNAAWSHPGGYDLSELSVEIGDHDSLVEQNSGVVFFWRSTSVDSGQ